MADEPLNRNRYLDLVRNPDGPRGSHVRHLLRAITDFCGRGTIEAWPSLGTLQAITDMARHTLMKAIDAAVEQGWLDVRKGQIGDMQRIGSIYRLRLPTGAKVAPVDDPQTGASVAPVEDCRPVQNMPETGARPVQNVGPSICRGTHELMNSKALDSDEEMEMKDETRKPEGQHVPKSYEQEQYELAVRRGEEIGVHQKPGESNSAFQGRVWRERAARGNGST